MNLKKTLIIVAFLALLGMCFGKPVFAQQSSLELYWTDNGKIIVQDLSDDDDQIEYLEIYFLDSGTKKRFAFRNILKGQVISLPLQYNLANLPDLGLIENAPFTDPFLPDPTSPLPAPTPLNPIDPPINTIDPQNQLGNTGRQIDSSIETSSAGTLVSPISHYFQGIGTGGTGTGGGIGGSGTSIGSGGENQTPVEPFVPILQPAVYYHFIDTDGQRTNAKFFVYLTGPRYSLKEDINPQNVFHPLLSKSLNTRKQPNSNNYFIDVEVFGKNITETKFKYIFAGSAQQKELLLHKVSESSLGEEGLQKFKGTLGPFNGAILLRSFVEVTAPEHVDQPANRYYYFFDDQTFDVISFEENDLCKPTVLSEKKSAPFKSNAFFSVESVSNLWVVEDTSAENNCTLNERPFKAVRLVDDDQEIDKVEFIISGGQEITSFSKENIHLGDVICVPVPENSVVFYNFMDSDGVTKNINYFLPVTQQDFIQLPYFSVFDHVPLLEHASVQAIPNDDCKSYMIKVKAKTTVPFPIPQPSLFLKYGFEENLSFFVKFPENDYVALSGSDTQTAFLLDTGEFEMEFGPFYGHSEFYANVYADNHEGGVDKILGLSQWSGFSGPETPFEVEECGNFIDDDSDGSIDEGCVLLPDLFFLTSEIPLFFVDGEQATVTATVKNAGLVGAQNFDVAFYINDSLISTKRIDSLAKDEETEVSFEFLGLPEFFGQNTLKLVIDPANSVTEISKQNNEVSKTAFVGKNSFSVVFNYNDTAFLGDTRQLRVFDRLGETVSSALVKVFLPSGETTQSLTNNQGVSSFILKETGTYTVTVTKASFEDFEGSFDVPQIILLGIKNAYSLGEEITVTARTPLGEEVSGVTVQLTTPLNETKTFSAAERFVLSSSGNYSVSVSRNSVEFFEETFIVSGLVESLFFGSTLGNLLFGDIINNPPLFVFILLLSLVATWFFYSKHKTIIPIKPKTTNEKRLMLVIKIFLAIILFLAPFQFSKFFGFNAGALIGILEILLLLGIEAHAKKKVQKKPVRI